MAIEVKQMVVKSQISEDSGQSEKSAESKQDNCAIEAQQQKLNQDQQHLLRQLNKVIRER